MRKLSEMTEKMSQTLLNGVVAMTGNVASPFVRSKAGKFLFASAPGEVLLASMDALSKPTSFFKKEIKSFTVTLSPKLHVGSQSCGCGRKC